MKDYKLSEVIEICKKRPNTCETCPLCTGMDEEDPTFPVCFRYEIPSLWDVERDETESELLKRLKGE